MISEREFGILNIDDLIDPKGEHQQIWLNRLTIGGMERSMKKVRAIPFYYGFARFDYNKETVVFIAWPFYYKYSHKFRRRQLRHRFGRWLRNVLIARLMK